MSAGLTADARHELLRGLAYVVSGYPLDRGTGGLEAVRLLRVAGATWSDVLPGPVFAGDEYALELTGAGCCTDPAPVDCGRAIRTMLHLASPYSLAEAAVLASRPDPTFDEIDRLVSIVRKLLAKRTEERVT